MKFVDDDDDDDDDDDSIMQVHDMRSESDRSPA